MVKKNILIAFHSKKVCLNISNVLKKNGIIPDYICQSGAKLRKIASYFGEGVIILGYKFLDDSCINIINDLWENFNIILIGNIGEINIYEDKKVYKLATPLKQEDFIAVLEMQLYKDTPTKIKKNQEMLIINKAKQILFEKYDFTEQNAHKYIQKKSMEKRQKIYDIAKIIVENKGEIL